MTIFGYLYFLLPIFYVSAQNCYDKDPEYCRKFASAGFCFNETYSNLIYTNCVASCGVCRQNVEPTTETNNILSFTDISIEKLHEYYTPGWVYDPMDYTRRTESPPIEEEGPAFVTEAFDQDQEPNNKDYIAHHTTIWPDKYIPQNSALLPTIQPSNIRLPNYQQPNDFEHSQLAQNQITIPNKMVSNSAPIKSSKKMYKTFMLNNATFLTGNDQPKKKVPTKSKRPLFRNPWQRDILPEINYFKITKHTPKVKKNWPPQEEVRHNKNLVKRSKESNVIRKQHVSTPDLEKAKRQFLVNTLATRSRRLFPRDRSTNRRNWTTRQNYLTKYWKLPKNGLVASFGCCTSIDLYGKSKHAGVI